MHLRGRRRRRHYMMPYLFWILLLLLLPSSIPVLGLTAAVKTSSKAAATTHSTKNNNSNKLIPIVYTIAGSDSGGGAGIQADLHAMHAWGCHGCSAITCLTAQNSVGVTAVHVPPSSVLQAQWEALQSDLPAKAIKIGMLGTRELAEQVGGFLRQAAAAVDSQRPWVVLDPVMISTSGSRLIEPEAQQAMVDHIFPFVDVLTPNKFEAEALLGRTLDTAQDVQDGARDLLAMGVRAVLIKGGHTAKGSDDNDVSSIYAQDFFLSSAEQQEPRLCDGGVWLRASRYDTVHTHGTGCTLSSSIAAALALGEQERQMESSRRGAWSSIDMVDACCLAKAYVTAGIYEGIPLGQGPGPVAQTSFPDNARHYPSIVLDPTRGYERPFRALLSDQDGSSDELGRILPIVDTAEWVERLCQIKGVTDLQLRIKNETDPTRILEQVQKAQDIVSSCRGPPVDQRLLAGRCTSRLFWCAPGTRRSVQMRPRGRIGDNARQEHGTRRFDALLR